MTTLTTILQTTRQIVIPKEARDVFGINEGDALLLLGDKEKGLALVKYDDCMDFVQAVMNAKKENK